MLHPESRRRYGPLMKVPSRAAAVAISVATVAAANTASAQTKFEGLALNQFDPAAPGDAFFGVPAPWVGGHLAFRAAALFDYAHSPFQFKGVDADGNPQETGIVGSQGTLHVNASFSLWDRVMVGVNVPVALLQSGEQPPIAGVDFHPPSDPAMGDLRFDLRGRLFGEYHDPFQIGASGSVHVPTGSPDAYTGDGQARGMFRLLLGGRAGSTVGFVWSANGGVHLRARGDAPAILFGGGAGLTFLDERITVGPEAYGSAQVGGDPLTVPGTTVQAQSTTSLEVLMGARARVVSGLTIGAAAGGVALTAIGTPEFRVVGLLGWAPHPERKAEKPAVVIGDKDDDGIRDDVDACPDVKGELQSDPAKDGCPPADKDGDEVLDIEDACPSEAGLRNGDATKNGCPADEDGDGIADIRDACPSAKGVPNADPKKNGCPGDRDADSIVDASDACPDQAGPTSADPKENGCPPDRDGDTIKNAMDACPDEPGQSNADPKKHGCPATPGLAKLTPNGIAISQQIRFVVYGKEKHETVDPVSNGLLTEIKAVIDAHPEITKIEVQGHTDDSGSEAFNDSLSQMRADAVRRWLIEAGVPGEKLVAKGYGYSRPLGDNRVKTGRQQNRRVEFVVLERKK